MSLTAETWSHKLPGYDVSNKGRLRKRAKSEMIEGPMPIFKVQMIALGGGAVERSVPAHQCTVSMSGALEFWRVTEHGKGVTLTIAPGRWITCEEVR